ncbi:MAG TPA: cupredoxin domain-containing protein [Candidatus Limnocylindrales bacterium]|nr:cupredoxin domain-containing protein [Candidatus Limnocylindrales bacterium]
MNLMKLTAAALLVLAVAACGSRAAASTPASTQGASSASSAPAASPTAGESTTTNATSITERDFKFDTPDVTVARSAVSLAVTNAGPTIHDLTIRDASGKVLGETEDLKAGASETLTLTLPAGKYVIFCSLPGHESLGLKGTLTVTP